MTKQQPAHKKITRKPGTWDSPISAHLVANGSARLSDVRTHNGDVYWLESVASEQGRMTIMRHNQNQNDDILPAPFSVRSQVHEYGGAPYCFADDSVYFVNAKDQGIYRIGLNTGDAPKKIVGKDTLRFGDLTWVDSLACILTVCEEHVNDHEVNNSLVCIDIKGAMTTLHAGYDFYAYPRVCPLTSRLAWITWQHPNMPWDQTDLWLAELKPNATIANAQRLNLQSQQESIVQPYWDDAGSLYFVSDRNQWWNIFKFSKAELDANSLNASCVLEKQAEYASPLWELGMQNFTIRGNKVFAAHTHQGVWKFDIINLDDGATTSLNAEFSSIDTVCSNDDGVYFLAGKTHHFSNIYRLDINEYTLSPIRQTKIEHISEVSSPESVFIKTNTEQTLHAFYYPPHNTRFESQSPPPLIVLCHGGPTGQTSSELSYKIQYWTSRGFAIVDINYRGSTGFGRAFRHSLYTHWGIYDVEDTVSVVNTLIEQGKADEEKIIIKGGSAGGFTVLAALAFTDRFNAGVSLYGVGDLELLAQDTHKFEQHYLDQLIGPYPSEKDTYQSRSPINSANQLNCPLLLFQGLQDKVVPPNQARTMASSVDDKGIPVALIEFEDEGHGFRAPKNIEHMLEAELIFYQKVFALAEPKESELITIKNLD